MRLRLNAFLLPLAVTFLHAHAASAQVRLPHVFSDHAVLQRDKPIHVWGWSAPNETITVKFHEQTFLVTATKEGLWETYLRPESAGGPYTLSVSGSSSNQPVTLSDLLVGDVWIASGQSNMEFPMRGFSAITTMKNSAAEIAAADHPEIRLLLQPRKPSDVPLYDAQVSWTVCTPQTAATFSAVAYFFGREISEKEHVPIGLIDTSFGGSPAQSWISAEGIAYSHLPSIQNDAAEVASDQGHSRMLLEHYDELTKAGVPNLPRTLRSDHQNSWIPSVLYNGMLAPYTPLSIKGVIWYQGEADSLPNRGPYYARVFPALIEDWRRQFAQGDIPFLYVQLATPSGANEFGEVRDAQRGTLALRNTGMAVTLDVGMKGNVHPPDKQTVGHRLALSALNIVYNEPIAGSSPLPVQVTSEGAALRVWLSHADGLRAGDSGIGDFEIADDKGVYHNAKARIEMIGNDTTLWVNAAEVKFPTAVRYGWAGLVTHYLYNSAGLPLSTFISERIPSGAIDR